MWEIRFGAQVTPGDGTVFRVWAPAANTVDLRLLGAQERIIPMEPLSDGSFEVSVEDALAGQDYYYVLDGERDRPDPVSRFQPHGVRGPSRAVDPNGFSWSDQKWRGLRLQDFLMYEIHTGTFTREGTFKAIIPRLGYLRELGVTAVELMPVAQFSGSRNWGYDGVFPYAPHNTYGGPEGLKQLVDACHKEGLAFVLDIVCNHAGPEGNCIQDFGPYFTGRYRTPWGKAVTFDGPDSDGVRRFYVDNALYWLTEYHVDALRLDAVQGIYDFSARHVLKEMSEAFHRQAAELGHQAWLIAESNLNDARVVRPATVGGYGVDAQWSDDFHHSLHALMTGDSRGYFADFGRTSDLDKAITRGFVQDGSKRSVYRRRKHGSSSEMDPGHRFVVYAQNHDQVANASRGRRLASLVSLEEQKLAAMILFCSPFLPLIFMGQEYGEVAPFHFFISFEEEALIDAVREGRRNEFSDFGFHDDFPDPQAEDTFIHSRLDWSLAKRRPFSEILLFYQDLIALRRSSACLSNARKDLTYVECDDDSEWLTVGRSDPSGDYAALLCNLAEEERRVPAPFYGRSLKLTLWSGHERYGGDRSLRPPEETLRPGEGAALAPATGAIYAPCTGRGETHL